MKKYSVLIVAVSLAGGLQGCEDSGSDTSQAPSANNTQNIWRLNEVVYNAKAISNGTNINANSVYSYESEHEITAVNQFGLAQPVGSVLHIPVLRQIYSNVSAQEWSVQISYFLPKVTAIDLNGNETLEPDNATVERHWVVKSNINYSQWGDDVLEWAVVDQWVGADEEGDIDWQPAVNSTPLETEDFFIPVSERPQRSYNAWGQLTHLTYAENTQGINYNLEYRDDSLLKKITRITPAHENALTGESTPESQASLTYNHQKTPTQITSTIIETNNLEGVIYTYTAIYSQQPCGPMTLERSKKQVPQYFPVCLSVAE